MSLVLCLGIAETIRGSHRKGLDMRFSKYTSPIDRFTPRIKVNPETGCHEWLGCRTRYGYGNFCVDNKVVRAHRWIYFYHHPDADRSLFVCHHCDNPCCVKSKN